jgi:glycosyltransferase involved in cell wall biosynthesis
MGKAGLESTALGAGWRVLRRHLRNAGGDPRKLLWIARRAFRIATGGQLGGVLSRHQVVESFYGDYPAWARIADERARERSARLLADSAGWAIRPRFSVLMPVHRPPQAFLDAAIASVVAQDYPDWELCIVDDASPEAAHWPALEALAARDPRVRLRRRASNGGIAAATNDALALSTGDYCVFLDQDDVLAREALLEFAARVAGRPTAQLLYGDEDHIDAQGARSRPFFKPDWDREWLRTTNCVMHPVAIRADLLRRLGGMRTGIDGVQDWDLLLRADEVLDPSAIEHVPRVLYHWRIHSGSTAAGIYEKPGVVLAQERALRDSIARRGERAEVEKGTGGWRIRHALPANPPLATLVIPTRDGADLLRTCIAGLRERTDYRPWEAVIVDNGTTEPEALAILESLAADPRFRILRDPRPFNYPALCNAAVAAAHGEVVVLLNNDIDPIDPGWLGELVSQCLRPGIGLAGALLYYPDDTIQHAGVILGLNGVADRPYIGYPKGFRGVDNRLASVHTVTAMITACAAVRRSLYLEVGGMDESLPVDCNDLDLCLRIAQRGYRNVLTPHAELHHLESASRGYHTGEQLEAGESPDEARFRLKWPGSLDSDPTYNPNLALRGKAFSLRHGEI